jgi:hypothetical protein
LEYKWGLEYYTRSNVCTKKNKWNNTAQGGDLENMRDKEMDLRKADVLSV